ncbi:unnamed protein product [Hydatigera taeniaeformis]|uniref:DUF1990 domain-containing protein n=1 Tax=Hydatigena taeniaeformis TaxID=6205 RepID=A0A0R3WQL9_HYDTA|nr:unnamed protein product [Hydatigera taeniaeformis]
MMNRYTEKTANCPDAEMLEAFRTGHYQGRGCFSRLPLRTFDCDWSAAFNGGKANVQHPHFRWACGSLGFDVGLNNPAFTVEDNRTRLLSTCTVIGFECLSSLSKLTVTSVRFELQMVDRNFGYLYWLQLLGRAFEGRWVVPLQARMANCRHFLQHLTVE